MTRTQIVPPKEQAGDQVTRTQICTQFVPPKEQAGDQVTVQVTLQVAIQAGFA